MRYNYTATKSNGEITEGEVIAQNLSEALQSLASQRLKPISVKPVGEEGRGQGEGLWGSKIDINDKVFIFRYLTLMLSMGTNLLQAIDILIQDFDKPAVKSFLREVKMNLERGSPFYRSFEKYPKVFSGVTVNLIKAGEKAGNLEDVTANVTEALIKEKDLQDQIKSAFIYPTLLLSLAVLVLLFLVTFALPKIADVFLTSGFEPPIFTQIVFTVGIFFGKIWYLVILMLFGGAGATVYFYKKSLPFKKFIWSVLGEVPVVKDIIKKRALQRFTTTASSLIRAGIPITEALEITASAVGHVELKDALLRVSGEGLSQGLTLGEAFKRETFFPSVVVNLISIAEQAGHIEDVLDTLGDFYIKEIDTALKRFISLLEPALLLFIGVVVGAIALSVIVPIYQLTTQF